MKPRTDGLVIGILVAALVGCASPTRPNPDGAVVTSSAPAGLSGRPASRFAAGGPNAEEYGAREGYLIRVIYRVPFFVGLFSHYDQIFESRMIRRAATPSRLTRAAAEPALRYEYQAETLTLDDYLAQPHHRTAATAVPSHSASVIIVMMMMVVVVVANNRVSGETHRR